MKVLRTLFPAALILGLAAVVALLSGRPGGVAAGTSPCHIEELLVIPVNGAGGSQAMVMVDTLERKILVYRLDANSSGKLMLNAVRDYKYDLFEDEWPPKKGAGDFKAVMDEIKDREEYKKAKKEGKDGAEKGVADWVKGKLKESTGQTAVVTSSPASGGSGSQPDLLWIVDKANKKLLVYQMASDKLDFLACRKYEYDQKLPDAQQFSSFVPFLEVKKKWQEWQKKQEEEEKKGK